jgi:hypothetical protein
VGMVCVFVTSLEAIVRMVDSDLSGIIGLLKSDC